MAQASKGNGPAAGLHRPVAAYWADEAGPRWVRDSEQHDRELAPLLTALLTAAALQPGERVVDVGCGAGTTTLEAAALVAPTGSVLGVDVSADLLAELRRRTVAAAADIPALDVQTMRADAEDAELPGPFDVLISRLGVMFFADQVVAWSNLHRAMAPGGRAAVVVWQDPAANPWMVVPARAALAVSPAEVPPPGPGEPGAHALADVEETTRRLTAAGWSDLSFTAVRHLVELGADLDAAVAHSQSLASIQAAIARAGADDVLSAIRTALEPFVAPDGAVRMQAANWVITARA